MCNPYFFYNKLKFHACLKVIEDHRPFDTDVSIETFYKKCNITLTFTKDFNECIPLPLNYVCRYRLIILSRRKAHLEPVLDEERKALALLSTPVKFNSISKSSTPKTPSSLIKQMSRVSITDQKLENWKNWSVSKSDGTKILLKRAILADKIEKESPKKVTPKSHKISSETPKVLKKLDNFRLEEALSMELQENSDDELPTLIIRQHVPSSPKRKQSMSKINEQTPKKKLFSEDIENRAYTTRSGRVTKNCSNYMEQDASPIKRSPRKSVRKLTDSDDDFKPAPRTPKTPRTPRTPHTPKAVHTPKRSVTKRILTSQLTPTLRARAHSVDNIDGKYSFSNNLILLLLKWQHVSAHNFAYITLIESLEIYIQKDHPIQTNKYHKLVNDLNRNGYIVN